MHEEDSIDKAAGVVVVTGAGIATVALGLLFLIGAVWLAETHGPTVSIASAAAFGLLMVISGYTVKYARRRP